MDWRGPDEDPDLLAGWRAARRRRRLRRRRPARPAWDRILALAFCLACWLLAAIALWREAP